jgi:8-oxo-dGTP pyrophosphatase MutT (NUDIX family)
VVPASTLLSELAAYAPADPAEGASLERVRRLLRGPVDPYARANPEGHVTGSAVIARPDGSAFLLVHHRKLERWLQPGGHVDPADATVLATALREAREETGLGALAPALGGRVLDVDVHVIPARHAEPAHAHFDLRYLLTTREERTAARLEEVGEVAWFTFAEAVSVGADASLARALRKAVAVLGVER